MTPPTTFISFFNLFVGLTVINLICGSSLGDGLSQQPLIPQYPNRNVNENYNHNIYQSTLLQPLSPFDNEDVRILSEKYKNKFICTEVNPDCEIFLCGTLHVAKSSADFVVDVIRNLRPDFVIVELWYLYSAILIFNLL